MYYRGALRTVLHHHVSSRGLSWLWSPLSVRLLMHGLQSLFGVYQCQYFPKLFLNLTVCWMCPPRPLFESVKKKNRDPPQIAFDRRQKEGELCASGVERDRVARTSCLCLTYWLQSRHLTCLTSVSHWLVNLIQVGIKSLTLCNDKSLLFQLIEV